jgi:hypothetical protein
MSRWEHEELLEAMPSRWAPAPDSRRRRRQTVAHPFGTLQAGMGATHFPTQTLKNISTEMSLPVPAYHLKRVMKISGTSDLMEAMGVA